jgi:hypothetical protein
LNLQEPEEAEKGADKEEKLKKLKRNWVESRTPSQADRANYSLTVKTNNSETRQGLI